MKNKRLVTLFGALFLVGLVLFLAVRFLPVSTVSGNTAPVDQTIGWRDAGAGVRDPEPILLPVTGVSGSENVAGASALFHKTLNSASTSNDVGASAPQNLGIGWRDAGAGTRDH